MTPIYLDYNATTPIDPDVLRAMLPYLDRHFGNPSSRHAYGQAAHQAIDQARAQLANLIGAHPDEIVFTGGGSEASNQAIKGVVFQQLRSFWGRWLGGRHIITSAIEHPATLRPCEFLRQLGCTITILPVDGQGVVDLDALRKALKRSPRLVSIMHSNNEVGTLQPIQEIARLAHAAGALVHTDVAQSLGKVRVDVNELGVDLLSIAGHKLYAPKGVGALYVRRGVQIEPLIHGAGQESSRRAGTENVPYIVALGQAASIAAQSLPAATTRLRELRDRLQERLRRHFPELVLNGHPEQRLPNTLNVSFPGRVGSEVLAALPEIAASTGSACHEGQEVCSPVLRAMNLPPRVAQGAVRLSVGRFTTEEQIDRAAELFAERLAAREPAIAAAR